MLNGGLPLYQGPQPASILLKKGVGPSEMRGFLLAGLENSDERCGEKRPWKPWNNAGRRGGPLVSVRRGSRLPRQWRVQEKGSWHLFQPSSNTPHTRSL